MADSKAMILRFALFTSLILLECSRRGSAVLQRRFLQEQSSKNSERFLKKKKSQKKRSKKDSDGVIFDRIDSEKDFLEYCQGELFVSDVTSDGLISQDDASNFIGTICGIFDEEALPAFSCPSPTFSSLEIDIQFSFVYFICPEDEELSLVDCYSDLIEQGEFGYPVTTFSEEEIARENVFGFCCSLLPFLSKTSIDPLKGNVCSSVFDSASEDSKKLLKSTTNTSTTKKTNASPSSTSAVFNGSFETAPSPQPNPVLPTSSMDADIEKEHSTALKIVIGSFVCLTILVFGVIMHIIARKRKNFS